MSGSVIELSALHDIGWREWDPIGLGSLEGPWQTSDAADEYDRYLLNVARALKRGTADKRLVDYLVEVETEEIGLTPRTSTRPRAVATVTAIREYVLGLT